MMVVLQFSYNLEVVVGEGWDHIYLHPHLEQKLCTGNFLLCVRKATVY